MRSYGRMKDGSNGKDIRAMGANPCFTGDTKVDTPWGQISFEDLSRYPEAPVYCYDGKKINISSVNLISIFNFLLLIMIIKIHP